jgi:hypothetical protein
MRLQSSRQLVAQGLVTQPKFAFYPSLAEAGLLERSSFWEAQTLRTIKVASHMF